MRGTRLRVPFAAPDEAEPAAPAGRLVPRPVFYRFARAHYAIVIGALALTFLVGCKVGPDYQQPAPLGTNAIAGSFAGVSTNGTVWKAAKPSAHLPRHAWWKMYRDEDLNRLEEFVELDNQQLALALARFDQARASTSIAKADLLPQVSTSPTYIRQRTSFNEPEKGVPAGTAPTFNTFLVPAEARWEIDLWGRVRRQVESARAEMAASATDIETLKLSFQAEIAGDYITLRSLDIEYDLIVRTVEAYRRSLELTVNRRKGGIASDLDVAQAETQLKTAEADLPVLRLARAKLIHAMATLCGQSATDFSIPPVKAPLPAAPPIPVSLPSELLERRPDIAAAESRMASANAQVGVAQGAFYPRLYLNGLAGFQSIDASTWFNWPSRFWAVGPSLELPLFTGGRNRAQLAFAQASYQETVAGYRETVLEAFQEVEDRLSAQNLLKIKLDAEIAAMNSAQRTLQVAQNRYQAGLVTYLEVAVAQAAALNLERTVVQLQGAKLAASVALIKALGGGWEANVAQ
jgi:outer membrane protein, multidrug efflux system